MQASGVAKYQTMPGHSIGALLALLCKVKTLLDGSGGMLFQEVFGPGTIFRPLVLLFVDP